LRSQLSKEAVQGYLPAIAKEIKNLFDDWAKMRDVTVLTHFGKFAASVGSRFLFSFQIEAIWGLMES
jgi:cytochrome P450